MKKTRGITLVALVVTIVVLLILAGITIAYVFGNNSIFKLAQNAKDTMEDAIANEKGEIFNNTVDYINIATNKKPEFEYIEIKNMAATSATIKVKAKDRDGEKLTYILYMGTTEDNLEEKDKKENVEQDTEIELTGTGIDITNIVYYRIDVKDRYATVQTKVSTFNNKKPEIKKAEIEDITKTSAKAVIKGKDEDIDDKLKYKVYYGIDKNTLETTGKSVEKNNIASEIEETLNIEDLKPKTTYYYKILVTDEILTTYAEGEFTTLENHAPEVSDVSVSTVSSKTFTVKFKATDVDGDNLTYKLTWGEADNTQTGNSTRETKKEDGYIYIEANGLKKLTNYRYKVYAYDGIEEEKFGNSQFLGVKTWCDGKGNSCTGFVDCSKCSGKGTCSHTDCTSNDETILRWESICQISTVEAGQCTRVLRETCRTCGAQAFTSGVPISSSKMWYDYISAVKPTAGSTYNYNFTEKMGVGHPKDTILSKIHRKHLSGMQRHKKGEMWTHYLRKSTRIL